MQGDRTQSKLNGEPPKADELSKLKRSVTAFSSCIAVATAVIVPFLFFFTAHHYESARIAANAKVVASRFSDLANTNPKTWMLAEHRFVEMSLLDPERQEMRFYEAFDAKGSLFGSWGTMPPSPAASAIASIYSFGGEVGRIRITEPLRPVLAATMWVLLLGTGLAAAIFIVLRSLPLRALDKAFDEVIRSSSALKNRVEDLEAAKRLQELQSKQLSELSEVLAIARDEANLANRAKSEFLTNMSHELRTPLNAIIGFSDMIRTETFGPIGVTKYAQYIDDIKGSGEHLLKLINDILDLSKIEAGKIDLHEESVTVHESIKSCLALVRERARDANVTIESDVASNQPPLYVDARMFKQIMINLLSNAVKFTPAGGQIKIRAWCRTDEGFVVQVADTGIGISRENICRAMIPFQQIDGKLDRKYEGTGLGLPLTKSLVELHGGILDIKSELGAGTTVTVHFPPERVGKGSSDLQRPARAYDSLAVTPYSRPASSSQSQTYSPKLRTV